MIPIGGPIAQNDKPQSIGAWRDAARPIKEPPPWLAASVAEFGSTEHLLEIVRPIRTFSFGGVLVFVTLLAFLLGHSPRGQSTILVASVYGLPLCLATWFVASRLVRRMNRRRNRIQQRLYEVGLRLDEDGNVLTDNPHAVLILGAACGTEAKMS